VSPVPWAERCAGSVGRSVPWSGTRSFSVVTPTVAGAAGGSSVPVVLTSVDGRVVSAGVDEHARPAAQLRPSSALEAHLAGAGPCPTGPDAVMVTLDGVRHPMAPSGPVGAPDQVAPADLDLTIGARLTECPVGELSFSLDVAGGLLRSFGPVELGRAPDVEVVVTYEDWFAALAGHVPYTAVTEADHVGGSLWAISHLLTILTSPAVHATFERSSAAASVVSAFTAVIPVETTGHRHAR
jgi:hypothetical protein